MGTAEIVALALTAAKGLIDIGSSVFSAVTAPSPEQVLADLDRVLADARDSVANLRSKLAANDKAADAKLAEKFDADTKP